MLSNMFVVLGSSSGMSQANRATSGYILQAGESMTLIDCGGGVTSSFLKRGLDPLAVDRVFISHTHSDHVCELTLFIQLIHLKGREQPFDVYIPEEFVEPFRSYLNAVYLIPERVPFTINLIGYHHGFTYNDGFTLKAIANNHLSVYEPWIKKLNLPNKMQCFSLAIELNGKTIFYTSDIRDLDDVKKYLDGQDMIIIETTHIDLDAFFELAQTVKVGKFILTHLGTKEEVFELERKTRATHLQNIVMAYEGLTIEI
ncbi:MAG: MBL fold metallo-hydrolase [FCB group bacterium]|nr:MBL fold metallo-hydrolase [FCB group bacterium]